MEEFKLKNHVLSSEFTVEFQWKKLDSIFDIVTAGIINRYVTSPYLKLSIWWRNMAWGLAQLPLVYGSASDEVKKYISDNFRHSEFVLKWYPRWQIDLSDKDTVISDYGRISDFIKLFVADFYKEHIKTNDELNSSLATILSYGIFSDEEFNSVTNYFFKIIFNTSIDKKNKSYVNIWDQLLQLTIEDWENISDDLINYVEQKVLWYDFDTEWLRKVIWFEPWGWQRYALISQKRFNYVVSCRKSWKSFLMAYLVVRQLFLPKQDIVYLVPMMDMAEQVFDYIERFIRDIGDEWLRFDRARARISYTRTRSVCTFVSWESKYAGRSKKAHFLFIDEASFVNDRTRMTVRPFIVNTEWSVFAVSTIDPKTPINWFYFWFKRGELGIESNTLSIRIDIYNNCFMSDNEKQTILREYANDPLMLQTEWLAIFPSSSSWFNVKDFFINRSNYKDFNIGWVKMKLKSDFKELKEEYNWFVLWYDPAMRRDKWGFSIIGYKKMVTEDLAVRKHVFEVVGSSYINIVDYTTQINVIKDTVSSLEDNKHSVVVAMDYTGAGMWVYELMRGMWVKEIRRILRTWNNNNEPTYDNWVWKVSKVDLESFFRAAMGTVLFWYNYLSELKSEIEMYWVEERVWQSHFDQLSAAFVAYFICKRYVGDNFANEANRPDFDADKIVDYLDNLHKWYDENYEIFGSKQQHRQTMAWERYKRFIY